ncbi:MAG: hypothetical protein HKN44_11325 [Ilumatobacter sp.]|nr:hypothetical protein [Ilumatobacter sp.]
MAKTSPDKAQVQEFAVEVSPAKAGCLAESLDAIGGQRINSAACACTDGAGVATFAVASSRKVDIGLRGKDFPVRIIDVTVANQAGCLDRVVNSFDEVGVAIGSLACACSTGDAAGTISIGLRRG